MTISTDKIISSAIEAKHKLLSTATGAAIGATVTPSFLNAADNPTAMLVGMGASQVALIGGAIHGQKTLGTPKEMVKGIVAEFVISTAACFQLDIANDMVDAIKNAKTAQPTETSLVIEHAEP